jgi:dihydrofolate reductase
MALRDATRARQPDAVQSSRIVTENKASWADSAIASGKLAAGIARLKQQPGEDILAHGGARFAQSLLKHGLVDEYRPLVHPAARGSGLALSSP